MFLLQASTSYNSAFWMYSLIYCLFLLSHTLNLKPELVNCNWIYFGFYLSSPRNLQDFFVFLAAIQQMQLFRWSLNLQWRDYDLAFITVHMHASDKSGGREITGIWWRHVEERLLGYGEDMLMRCLFLFGMISLSIFNFLFQNSCKIEVSWCKLWQLMPKWSPRTFPRFLGFLK
jgi:hypothetical protein